MNFFEVLNLVTGLLFCLELALHAYFLIKLTKLYFGLILESFCPKKTTQFSAKICNFMQKKFKNSMDQFVWSKDLVVKALDSQSRGPLFKDTGWLQVRLSLSSFYSR